MPTRNKDVMVEKKSPKNLCESHSNGYFKGYTLSTNVLKHLVHVYHHDHNSSNARHTHDKN